MAINGHIKRELQRVIMLTSIVSLLLACAGFVTYDFISYRRAMVRDLTALADMLASNIQAALVFNDTQGARDTLDSLSFRQEILSAAVYQLPNDFFAGYRRAGEEKPFPSSAEWNSARFENGSLILFRPVLFDEKPIGVLFLESDLETLYARFQTYLTIAALLLLLASLVAWVLSTRLQAGISRPILELAEAANAISVRNDFSVRVKNYPENEIGVLAKAFNQMLEQIGARDTALRHSNESLAKLNQELEERVKQRTAALKDSTEQMQVFTYTVAHDLRAPLRAMKGLAMAVIEDYGQHVDRMALDYLDRIQKSADHMDALIEDLLAYSQISREELKFEQVDLNRIVDTVLDLAAHDIEMSKAQILVERPLPPVIGHAATLENVVLNLVSNAIKYMAPNIQPRIRVYAEHREIAIRLWVDDNGIGIAPEFHQTIFGIFTRLHGKDEYPGTGIGLALVRKGVERIGGRVGVESRIGQGSRFWIELVSVSPMRPKGER